MEPLLGFSLTAEWTLLLSPARKHGNFTESLLGNT